MPLTNVRLLNRSMTLLVWRHPLSTHSGSEEGPDGPWAVILDPPGRSQLPVPGTHVAAPRRRAWCVDHYTRVRHVPEALTGLRPARRRGVSSGARRRIFAREYVSTTRGWGDGGEGTPPPTAQECAEWSHRRNRHPRATLLRVTNIDATMFEWVLETGRLPGTAQTHCSQRRIL